MLKQNSNMDDLFRHASENYPLNIDKGDWNVIASVIETSPKSKPLSEVKYWQKQVKIVFITLFLISLPSSLYFLNRYISVRNTSIKSNNTVHETKSSPPSSLIHSKQNALKFIPILPVNKLSKFSTPVSIIKSGNLQTKENKGSAINLKLLNKKETTSLALQNQSQLTLPCTINSKFINHPGIGIKHYKNMKVETSISIEPLVNNNQQNIIVRRYVHLVAGVGFNEVKQQSFSRPGVEAGIRLGFRISKRWALETGLLYAEKYYSSAGKYFNMKKAEPAMQNMDLLSMNGASNIIQIPVKVKFNIHATKKGVLFSTAGISSYILIKEKNNYEFLLNGTRQQMEVIYKEPRRYLVAALDISTGYELPITNKKTLRIEPYLQIPLKGVGIGLLPVTSAGIHVSYPLLIK